jgi:hypothetical protein
MRRIYQSDALDRDDDDPFQPGEREGEEKPRAARTLPVRTLSDALLPTRLRHRAISVDVSSPQDVYEAGETVPFTVTMKNAMPFPVSVPTASPLLWTWAVDGHREASHVPETPAQEPSALAFDRGEWKTFRRRWDGMFQVAEAEWTDAGPGEYTIRAGINVGSAPAKGVHDETTVEIR